jgi:hypothetical protein
MLLCHISFEAIFDLEDVRAMVRCRLGLHKFQPARETDGAGRVIQCQTCGAQPGLDTAIGLERLFGKWRKSDERPLVHLNADDL